MLNKNKIIKIGLIATLVVFAVLCIVVLSKKNSQYNKKSDSRVLSTWDMDMTPQEKGIVSWSSYGKKDDMMYIFNGGTVFKWDYKSVGFRPACDDPACEHSTDECPALFPLDVYERVVYYNDHWIYVEKDDANRYYLGYCDFDGNNRKRVLDITDDVKGTASMMYLEICGGKIYCGYNLQVIDYDDAGDWDTKSRLCVMEYDVQHLKGDKAYSRQLFLCDDDQTWHFYSVNNNKMVIDVPVPKSDTYVEFGEERIYDLKDLSYITVKETQYVGLLSDNRYVSKEKEGLILVDGDKRIRLEGKGWGVPFYNDNRIYAINTQYRQSVHDQENGKLIDGEVKAYDYEGNVVEHIYLPKGYGVRDGIAAYDGRYYFTNIDYSTRSYFYVYDTQNPDKGWKKINRGY